MARMYLAEGEETQTRNGVIVASGWKARNDIIRMVFRNSVINPEGKRVNLKGGVTFNGNDALLIVPVKNKKQERSPDYVGIAFPNQE